MNNLIERNIYDQNMIFLNDISFSVTTKYCKKNESIPMKKKLKKSDDISV